MWLSIGLKLGFGFSVLLLAIVVISGYGLRVSEENVKSTVGRQTIITADHLLEGIHSRLLSLHEKMLAEVNQPLPRHILAEIVLPGFQLASGRSQHIKGGDDRLAESVRQLSQQLSWRFIEYPEKREGYSDVVQLMLLDRQSKVFIRAGSGTTGFKLPPAFWPDIEARGYFISRPIQLQDGKWVVSTAIAIINDQGDVTAALLLNLDLSFFFQSIRISGSQYRTTQVHILTGDGKRLFSTQAFKLLEDVSSRPYFKKIKSNSGYFLAEKGGREKIFSHSQATGNHLFGHLKWMLLVEMDASEVLLPVTELRNRMVVVITVLFVLMGTFAYLLSRSITRSVGALQLGAEIIGQGNLDYVIQVRSRDEIGDLSKAFNEMTDSLRTADTQLKERQRKIEYENWQKTGLSDLNLLMQGRLDSTSLGQSVLQYLADYLEALTGAIYLTNDRSELELISGYAYNLSNQGHQSLKPGEGFIGQAFQERTVQVLENVPDQYFAVTVGQERLIPTCFIAIPFQLESDVAGVLFLGGITSFKDMEKQFLESAITPISLAFYSTESRKLTEALLGQTQEQSTRLEEQREALEKSNEDLENQAQALRLSEARLQEQQEELQKINEELETQQEELMQINEELEEKTEALELKNQEIQSSNQELNVARMDLEDKARDLELSSRYKSEFLANMSHELRTPLNSLLIMAQLLAENKDGNLSEKQVDFANTIHSSGSELLSLINDILDLAKIESGKSDLLIETVKISEIRDYFDLYFRHVVEKKSLSLNIEAGPDLPAVIQTDRRKMFQVLKNLMSNAIKFTEDGAVDIRFFRPDSVQKGNPDLQLGISISDTGIGIPEDKIDLIFEAFQQADGSTIRTYGGTGLGLSITRELTGLLQGILSVESRVGEGSTFTLLLPFAISENVKGPIETTDAGQSPEAIKDKLASIVLASPADAGESKDHHNAVPVFPAIDLSFSDDDRKSITSEDKVILVIDDDPKFAMILRNMARERQFKCLLANDGQSGLEMAVQWNPDAILLDINLPQMDGWEVMERLKADSRTCSIPVHFISIIDKKMIGLKMGAVGFLTKPVSKDDIQNVFQRIDSMISKTINDILVVEDDDAARKSLVALFESETQLKLHFAENAEQAISILHEQLIDLIILDLRLPDISGAEMLSRLENELSSATPPVIVYTAKNVDVDEEAHLMQFTRSIILKGVNSADRLLDEVSLFLHRVDKNQSKGNRQLTALHNKESVLQDKRILLVDDDMRNVYAIMEVLEGQGMVVQIATNGQKALDVLEMTPDIDIVLMDIMMPVLDGYEAIQRIREQPKWQQLPIIALTAKAMKGDRDCCIDAGANDYLSKPVEIEKLLTLLRVWLYG